MITVMYSCAGCGVHRVSVAVPARGDEPVVDWMEKTLMVTLGFDHSARSPFCESRSMSELMIPMTGAECIGGPALN
jgi:hypothetical protein